MRRRLQPEDFLQPDLPAEFAALLSPERPSPTTTTSSPPSRRSRKSSATFRSRGTPRASLRLKRSRTPPLASMPNPPPEITTSRTLRQTASRRSSHSLVATGSTNRVKRRSSTRSHTVFGVPPAACLERLPWCGVAPAVVAHRLIRVTEAPLPLLPGASTSTSTASVGLSNAVPLGVREEFLVTWPGIDVTTGHCVGPSAERRMREEFRAAGWFPAEDVARATDIKSFDQRQDFLRRMRLS